MVNLGCCLSSPIPSSLVCVCKRFCWLSHSLCIMRSTPENKQTEPSQSQQLNLGQTEKNGLVAWTPCLMRLSTWMAVHLLNYCFSVSKIRQALLGIANTKLQEKHIVCKYRKAFLRITIYILALQHFKSHMYLIRVFTL